MSKYFCFPAAAVSVRLSLQPTSSQPITEPLEDINDCACSPPPAIQRGVITISVGNRNIMEPFRDVPKDVKCEA